MTTLLLLLHRPTIATKTGNNINNKIGVHLTGSANTTSTHISGHMLTNIVPHVRRDTRLLKVIVLRLRNIVINKGVQQFRGLTVNSEITCTRSLFHLEYQHGRFTVCHRLAGTRHLTVRQRNRTSVTTVDHLERDGRITGAVPFIDQMIVLRRRVDLVVRHIRVVTRVRLHAMRRRFTSVHIPRNIRIVRNNEHITGLPEVRLRQANWRRTIRPHLAARVVHSKYLDDT